MVHAFHFVFVFSFFLCVHCILSQLHYVHVIARAALLSHSVQTCRRATCDMWSWSRVRVHWKPLRLHSIKFTRNEWIATKSHLLKRRREKKGERNGKRNQKRNERKTREPNFTENKLRQFISFRFQRRTASDPFSPSKIVAASQQRAAQI